MTLSVNFSPVPKALTVNNVSKQQAPAFKGIATFDKTSFVFSDKGNHVAVVEDGAKNRSLVRVSGINNEYASATPTKIWMIDQNWQEVGSNLNDAMNNQNK